MPVAPLIARRSVPSLCDEDVGAFAGEDVFPPSPSVLALAVAGPDECHASLLAVGMPQGRFVPAQWQAVTAAAVRPAPVVGHVFQTLETPRWEPGI